MTGLRLSRRLRMGVLALHVLALLGGIASAWGTWMDIAAQRMQVDQMREGLDRLDARLARPGAINADAAALPVADPFLPGASATIAGANLQDRVVAAIRAAGGTVTSSQVDTTGGGAAAPGASGPPFILLSVSFELPETALQALLYDLEAGTPALFVDQLAVDAAARGSAEASPDGRTPLKVAMTVSAFWKGDGKS